MHSPIVVAMERYFSHPKLMVGEYSKRGRSPHVNSPKRFTKASRLLSLSIDEPIKVMDPFLFMTDDTDETIKKTGLRQMLVLQDKSNSGLRGTNRCTFGIRFTSMAQKQSD